jgi:L-fuculose-phosphate aldolase
MPQNEIDSLKNKIVYLGKLMIDRNLTDTAGGNISARAGDTVCITPSYAGSRYQWDITPEQVLEVALTGEKIHGDGEISRESCAHLTTYRAFPAVRGIVHAHARNVLSFAVACKRMLPILECTRKFGTIAVTEAFAPAHSQELADLLVEKIRGQEAAIARQAAVVIARWHGLFAAGKTLEAAFDAAERINISAGILLQAPAFGMDVEEAMQRWHAALEADVAAYAGRSGDME